MLKSSFTNKYSIITANDAKIVVKRNGSHYKNIENAVKVFEKKYMSIEKVQNFLTTGMLWYETEGLMYSRDELEKAMEDLVELSVDIANSFLEEGMISSDVSGETL